MPLDGHFCTAPRRRRSVRFVWSADTAGQGLGIQPRLGRHEDACKTMRQVRPDRFIHCGDTIYADGPIAASVALNDGAIWKNLVTEETSKVAESLREFFVAAISIISPTATSAAFPRRFRKCGNGTTTKS